MLIKDYLGRPLKVGDYVARVNTSHRNTGLGDIARVTKIYEKEGRYTYNKDTLVSYMQIEYSTGKKTSIEGEHTSYVLLHDRGIEKKFNEGRQ